MNIHTPSYSLYSLPLSLMMPSSLNFFSLTITGKLSQVQSSKSSRPNTQPVLRDYAAAMGRGTFRVVFPVLKEHNSAFIATIVIMFFYKTNIDNLNNGRR